MIAGKRLGAGIGTVRHRIADPGILYVFNAGGKIAHHTGGQLLAGNKLACAEISNLHHIVGGARRHHLNRRPFFDRALPDPAEHDDAAVGIINRVKDQRL